MRIGVVSKPKLVKSIKKSQQAGWFGDASMNSIVLKRYDNEVFHLDLLEVQIVENAYYWIAKKSIKQVEELNDQLFNAYNSIGQRILICYVDIGNSKSDS